jgi:DNA-binding NarL/FixJ family response regulator
VRAIKLILCDDQRMFCSALAQSLDDATHEVLEVVDCVDQLVDHVRGSGADVCVTDVMVRGRAQGRLAAAVKQASPGTHLLVLTSTDDADLWRAYDDGVVDAVISKSHGLATIRTAIDRVAIGERFALASARPAVPLGPVPMNLTDREREILRLLARGATTHQITEALAISRNTVRTHVQHLLDKLHAHTRAQAVQFAVAAQLLLDSELVLS